ncbi:pentapeptide repeat-containing protein [Streptomyces chartreusis]|uniref:pentapeptide repeat-containing protein n=1 Tax=Streptomyces chartreusis TaxID=1969 RepID=UPI0036F6248B
MRRRLRAWYQQHSVVTAATLGVFAVSVFIFIYCQAPWWMDAGRLHAIGRRDPLAQHAILDKDRSQILKIAAGVGAFVALIYTARKHALDRKSHTLSEQQQITDRYIKSVEQLGSTTADVRLGGIYALGRVMADSPPDRRTVREVLAAYLRHHSPETPSRHDPTAGSEDELSVDVGAALITLARSEPESIRYVLDLRRTNLSGIEIVGGDGLRYANAALSRLYRINFVKVSLVGVNFYRSNLARAGLLSCDLTESSLAHADLTRATLHGSSFDGAYFLDANLSQANLIEANLSSAKELTAEQLSAAGIDASTRLPENLRNDPWVLARLNDCATWAAQWNWDALLPPPETPRPR